METPNERCNRCRFWLVDKTTIDPSDPDFAFGSCRRNPPKLVECIVQPLMPKPQYGRVIDCDTDPLDLIPASLFPATYARAWCGEYERGAAQ